MFLRLCFVLLVLPFVSLQANASRTCRGNVPVGSEGATYSVALALPEVVLNGRFSMFHPIVAETENGVQLTIISLYETQVSKLVIAQYEYGNSILTFNLTKDNHGETVLKDFRGFESTTAFGPADIVCREE